MASQSTEPATNERIVRLLEEVKAQLADSREQQERIARDVTRLVERKEARASGRLLGWWWGRRVAPRAPRYGPTLGVRD